MALSLSGLLWANGSTVISDQSAYNLGVQHIADYVNAHTSNITVNGVLPEAHQSSHITIPANSVNVVTASSNGATTLDQMIDQIATRIRAIEGGGTAGWTSSSAPTNLTDLLATVNGLQAGTTLAGKATVANALTTPQPTKATISDYIVTPSTTAGVVNVAAGSPYVDSAGNYIPAGVATTVTLPSQPTAGNSQYVWITKPTVTGTPHASTNGIAAASPTIPAYPIGEEPLALILYRGATANPTNVIAAGDITDIRYGHGGGVGGGGGGSAVPATPEVVVGSSGSAIDIFALAAGSSTGIVNGLNLANFKVSSKIVKNILTDASLDDAIVNSTNGPWRGAWGVSGASATLNSNNGRLFIDGGPLGRRYSDQTVNPGGSTVLTSANQIGGGNGVGAASGASAAIYNVYADFGSTGVPGFGITMFRQGVTVSGNVVGPLMTVLWDGSTLIQQSITPLTDGIIRSSTISRDTMTTGLIQVAYSTLTSGFWTDLSTTVQLFYTNAVPMKGRIVVCGSILCQTATSVCQLTIDQDTNIWTDRSYLFTLNAGQQIPFSLEFYLDGAHLLQPAVAAQHYFRVAALTSSPANISFQNVFLHAEFENAG